MEASVTFSDIVAAIALALSAYAIWKTSQFNRRQLSLIESQERVNEQILKQGESDALDAMKAELGASFVNLGRSKHRLKVFNKGKAQARNVRIEFPDGNSMVIESEIAKKFPMETMEQQQSVNLIAAVHMGSELKQTIILRWEDDHSHSNEKTIYLTC